MIIKSLESLLQNADNNFQRCVACLTVWNIAFNTVVWWRELGEMENEYISHNFSLFAIFLPIIIKIGGNFEEVLTKTILHSFFLRHGVVQNEADKLR